MKMRTLALAIAVAAAPTTLVAQGRRFEVTFPSTAHQGPLTGRLVLVVAKRGEPEPRLTLSPSGPAMFGLDLEQLRPDQPAVVDDRALGYPMRLSDLPEGDYFVQAVVNVYDQVRRSDGHTIWLPMNDGTIEFFTGAAGNLYSDVQPVHLGP